MTWHASLALLLVLTAAHCFPTAESRRVRNDDVDRLAAGTMDVAATQSQVSGTLSLVDPQTAQDDPNADAHVADGHVAAPAKVAALKTQQDTPRTIPPQAPAASSCDLNKGSWVLNPSLAAGSKTSKTGFDCSYRTDFSYLKYSYTAPGCNIQRLDAGGLTTALENKVMLIVGDSIASNLYSAVTWSMGQGAATPATSSIQLRPGGFISPQKKAEVISTWSTFFVEARDGEKQCHVDVLDPKWTSQINGSDFIVLMGFHHFFHNWITFYKDNKSLKDYTNVNAIEDTAKLIRDHIEAINYKGKVLIFTYPAGHASRSLNGQRCSEFTKPLSAAQQAEFRDPLSAQEAATDALNRVFGDAGSTFQLLDIFKMTNSRPDAHPGWTPGFGPDCAHWCVPGVPNTWADVLYSSIKGVL